MNADGAVYIETPENGTPTLVNPASALLQDLLHEQRAHRGSRGPASVNWEDDNGPRTPKGAEVQDDSASERARKISDALSAGLRQPREMGMREMDQVRHPKSIPQLVLTTYDSIFPKLISSTLI